jgi:hypothetical protein
MIEQISALLEALLEESQLVGSKNPRRGVEGSDAPASLGGLEVTRNNQLVVGPTPVCDNKGANSNTV